MPLRNWVNMTEILTKRRALRRNYHKNRVLTTANFEENQSDHEDLYNRSVGPEGIEPSTKRL